MSPDERTVRRHEISVDPYTLDSIATPHRRLGDDLSHVVSRAMRKLTPRQAEVIRFKVDEKLTFEQIGREMGMSGSSAHRLYDRAKRALRVELEQSSIIKELMNDD